MAVATDISGPVVRSEPTVGAGPQVIALAVLAGLAPFNLELPRDGWNDLYLRPLLIAALVVSVAVIARCRRTISRELGLLEVSMVIWLVAVWVSAAVSAAPVASSAAAIRLTAFGLLIVAARAALVTERHVAVVYRGMAIGLVAASLVGLLVLAADRDLLGTQYFFGAITSLGPHHRLTRPWSNSNVAGMAIAASAATILLWKTPRRYVAGAVVLGALLLTYSRGAVSGVLVASGVVMAIRRSRADLLRLVAAVALAGAVAVSSPGWAWRLAGQDNDRWYCGSIEPPADVVLAPGGSIVGIVVANCSERTWPATGSDRVELSARWVGAGQDWIWGEHRWELPADLRPGQSVTMTVRLGGSLPVGTYDIVWDVVDDSGKFFLVATDRTVASRGVVYESSIDPREISAVWLQPRRHSIQRPEIWDLSFQEFLDAPLLGVGPGQVRSAVDDRLDETQVFLGPHAHSLVVEPLATTGIVGAAPLFVILAGGVWRAARSSIDRPCTIRLVTLAGLAAVCTHGLVDYPLIFTSSAIPLALLVGVAWARPGPQREGVTASFSGAAP